MIRQRSNADRATSSFSEGTRRIIPPPTSAGRVAPVVHAEFGYGRSEPVRLAAPILLDAPIPARTSRSDWEYFAAGAALLGVTFVCGENACSLDPELALDLNGRIAAAPDLDRCIAAYRRRHRGLGELLVRLGPDDLRLGAAEYLIDRHGLEGVELLWGRTVWSCGDSTSIDDLDRAIAWKRRGDTVTPDPGNAAVQAAFRRGLFATFTRHAPRGFVDLGRFPAECDRLRGLGFRRIALRVAACEAREAALAVAWGSESKLDLLTIESDPGGRVHWAAVEAARRLAAEGRRVPDLALAGGFRAAEQALGAMAHGEPHVKAICIEAPADCGADPDDGTLAATLQRLVAEMRGIAAAAPPVSRLPVRR